MLMGAPESLSLCGSVSVRLALGLLFVAVIAHLTEGVARGHTISDPLVMPMPHLCAQNE